MNTTVIFSEVNRAATVGSIPVQIQTGVHYLGEFSAATQGYEFFEVVPESFIRALDDFNAGRFVSIETAHNEPPPNA